jgi:hypothetical protein
LVIAGRIGITVGETVGTLAAVRMAGRKKRVAFGLPTRRELTICPTIVGCTT